MSASLLATGCPQPNEDDDAFDTNATGNVDTGNDPETSTGEAPDDDTTMGDVDSTGDPTSDTTGEDVCEPTTVPIEGTNSPVAVVFLVDNSVGMAEEALEVMQRLNAFYDVLNPQLPAQIVMISAYSGADPEGVCIPMPLGSGGCPNADNNPPEYTHIDLAVTPLNALSHIFVTYEQWANALAPGTQRHIVVISQGDTGVAVGAFDESFLMLDPEENANYRVHASVGTSDCEEAVTLGANFAALSDYTGGYTHDLCSQNYELFFSTLIARIVNDTGDRCRWEVPPPPPGVDFDPDNIELLLDVDGIMTSPQHVADVIECNATSTGWYWENPGTPNVMLACPETCELLQDFEVVQSWVRFGCPEEGGDSGTGG